MQKWLKCTSMNKLLQYWQQQLTLLLPDSKTSYCLRGGETICPRWWQFDSSRSKSICGQVCSLHTSGGQWWLSCRQAVCLYPRAAAPWDRQTDGSRYSLMPRYGEGHKNFGSHQIFCQALLELRPEVPYKMFIIIIPYNLPWVLWHCWLGGRKSIRSVKNWLIRWWCVVICLQRGADCSHYDPADDTASQNPIISCLI